jgi:plasmid maintenance system antidote protein VapI
MEIHIGQLIKARLEETGMKKTEFARRINRSSQNVFDIFQRKSIDTELLATISHILECNFFESFTTAFQLAQSNVQVAGEMAQRYGSTANMALALATSEQELSSCRERTEQLGKEIAYLTEINALLKGK